MPSVDAVGHVAVIGAGAIGASWTAFFLSRGLSVSVYDPEPARAAFVARYIEDAWPTLEALGLVAGARRDQWSFDATLSAAVVDAPFIQECAPDDFGLKRQLFATLDELVLPAVVVASSTSSLVLSDLQQGLDTADRFVVAHPFNPPHIIPLVEVVGGRDTRAEVVSWCVAFFERLGKTVLRLRKEVPGHVVNRLQAALFQEAVWLVREGVAEVADIDRGISMGPGLRWALAGPFLTFHLGAQDKGIRGYLHHLGPAHQRMWQDLQRVEQLTPELVDAIARGVEVETDGLSVAALTARRHRLLIQLIRLTSETIVDASLVVRKPLN